MEVRISVRSKTSDAEIAMEAWKAFLQESEEEESRGESEDSDLKMAENSSI